MIDLHCHILPGLDDGAADLRVSLEMARMAIEDGITTIACTPHINPGVYDNRGPDIRAAVQQLQRALDDAGIPLQLVTGADVHLAPDLVSGLGSGDVLTIADSRYFLLEPPHHVAPPRLEDTVFQLMSAGYVPILTHPERLSWIEPHFDVIQRLSKAGVWMQLTAGSLTGRFGRRAKHWAERMLEEGLIQLVCTDAHNVTSRRPRLSGARSLTAERFGDVEAERIFTVRALGVLQDMSVTEIEQVEAGLHMAPDQLASEPS